LLKKIFVFFRGSVTKKDFRQDFKTVFSTIPNPVKHSTNDSLPEELGVHHGFRDYLYDEQTLHRIYYVPYVHDLVHLAKKGQNLLTLPRYNKDVLGSGAGLSVSMKKQEDAAGKMKYQIILEQVLALLECYPKCRVHISGHSLGGALATMFALEAAADERITEPVTCIISGAPKVGNQDFLIAFEELEKEGKLRCLHIANDQDPVTMSPPNGNFNPCYSVLCQSRKFRHVGLRVKLEESGYELTYPPKTRTYCGMFLWDCRWTGRALCIMLVSLPILALCMESCCLICILCCLGSLRTMRKHHTQLMYIRRLEYNKDDLMQLNIDDVNEARWKRADHCIQGFRSKTWYLKE